MSILRFKHAVSNPHTAETVGISNCGMELTVYKGKVKKEEAEDKKTQ